MFLADRRPSCYLGQTAGRAALEVETDEFLRILARDGVIARALRDIRSPLSPRARAANATSFANRKAASAVRQEVYGWLLDSDNRGR